MFKHEMDTRYDLKAEAKKQAEALERMVYAAVNVRDKRTCRACGHRANPDATGTLERAHHHHVVYRSAGGPTASWNVCLLCPKCHNAQHKQQLDVRGNAELGLEFWKVDDAGAWFLWKRERAPFVTERD